MSDYVIVMTSLPRKMVLEIFNSATHFLQIVKIWVQTLSYFWIYHKWTIPNGPFVMVIGYE